MVDEDRDVEACDRVDRRGFLGMAALALSGLAALAGAIVAAIYVAGPALRRGGQGDLGWSPIGKAPAGAEPTRHEVDVVSDAGWATSVTAYAVFLDAGPDGRPRAFSARCPHEGCQVEWRGERERYVCPCHNSAWTRDGERLGGPTKRGLDPLDIREAADGRLEVRYATFALDTSERIKVG